MNVITLHHLSVGYGHRQVLTDVNLSLPRGSLISLMGANGTGKSTLLRTLCGFLKPLEGRVLIEGADLSKLSATEVARRVSIVLTERTDVQGLTSAELVAMGRAPYTGFLGRLHPADKMAVRQAMEAVGIEGLSCRKVGRLSDGEQQKVMIAKALAQATPVVLLDEPTAFLDYPSKVMLMKTLRTLAQHEGKTILLTTHDIELAARLSDMLLEIRGQQIVRATSAEVLARIEAITAD